MVYSLEIITNIIKKVTYNQTNTITESQYDTIWKKPKL